MLENSDIQYAHLFDTDEIKTNVTQKSVQAGFANLLSQGLSLLITLVRAAILARLLTPEDYGIFTMVIIVVSFAVIFKDLGLSTATIREKEITHAQVSNLFWINTSVGVLSMIVVIAISPAIAWFYQDSRLVLIAVALSLAFLFGGLSVQHQALLKRQMQFGKIAYVTIVSSLLSSVLGIFVAFLTNNYWALVWMNVSQNIFLMIGFWYSIRWLPSLPKRGVGTKKFLKVGIDVAGLNAFSTITKNIDKIIAGRIATASILGLYSKGNQVPGMVSGQFRMAFFSIAMPALSSLQNDRQRFASYYYKFLSVVAWVTMSLSIFCFIFAEEIIIIYFGCQWVGATIYMKIFALNSFVMPVMTTLDQIPLALGYSRRYLAAGIVRCFGTIFCVTFGGYFYGIVGIVFGVVLANIITFVPFFSICVKKSPVIMKDYFKTILIPFLISTSTGIIFYIVNVTFSYDSVLYQLFVMLAYLLAVSLCFAIIDYLKIGYYLGIIQAIQNKLIGVKRK